MGNREKVERGRKGKREDQGMGCNGGRKRWQPLMLGSSVIAPVERNEDKQRGGKEGTEGCEQVEGGYARWLYSNRTSVGFMRQCRYLVSRRESVVEVEVSWSLVRWGRPLQILSNLGNAEAFGQIVSWQWSTIAMHRYQSKHACEGDREEMFEERLFEEEEGEARKTWVEGQKLVMMSHQALEGQRNGFSYQAQPTYHHKDDFGVCIPSIKRHTHKRTASFPSQASPPSFFAHIPLSPVPPPDSPKVRSERQEDEWNHPGAMSAHPAQAIRTQ
ncbi:hypothetical protein FA13DRAFT_1704290 [Coprinellus micaceus]|uniref:Uncharacterized protein n=1 Tax=Coprinellus micaceus TaxID=71717 RepID=A0A4Y7U1D1_COPMI|nr:hypothetical protein FA13DRAFT_1704290 [Coprinellus micaceus]